MNAERWIAVAVLCAMTMSRSAAQPLEPAGQAVDRGFVFSTTAMAYNNSLTGWSSILDSSVRYDFADIFGVEIGTPLYMTQTGYDTSRLSHPNHLPALADNYAALGDTYVILHIAAPGSFTGYQATITGNLPTGDTDTGISVGRATFDFNNRLQHTWRFFSPLVEFGVGDTNALINRRIGRPYTSLGMLSHFKAGADFRFLKVFALEGAGYENLPFGNQKIFSRVPVRHKDGTLVLVNGKRTFQWIYTGKAILEDSGVGGGLTFSPHRQLALFGFYQKSLNQSYGSVTFGITYTLGKNRKKADDPLGWEIESIEPVN